MTDLFTLAVEKFGSPKQRHPHLVEHRFGKKDEISVNLLNGGWKNHKTGEDGYLSASNSDHLIPRDFHRKQAKRERNPADKAVLARNNAGKNQKALKLWNRGEPAPGTQVENYLEARGLLLPDTAIKFVPDLWHGPTGSKWPAMVAEITDMASGEFIGVHRTFLEGSSKAPVTPNKMILGAKKGGVIRLIEDDCIDTRLAVAEGIETALTAIGQGWSCWAAVDAGNLRVLPVWPATDLIIFADNDESGTGLEAAKHLARRWKEAGGYAEISMPKREDTDWNDLLK